MIRCTTLFNQLVRLLDETHRCLYLDMEKFEPTAWIFTAQVHVATFTEASMMSAEEDSASSPDDDPYDDTDILNSAGTDEVTAHLAAAGMAVLSFTVNLGSCVLYLSPVAQEQSYQNKKDPLLHFSFSPNDLFLILNL